MEKHQVLVKGARGFTLVEILIVLGIIGGLMAVLISSLGGAGEGAKKKETGVRAGQIQSCLLRYQTDMQKMPSSSEGLNVLHTNPGSSKWSGPYCQVEDIKDAWGLDFSYELTPKGPQLVSAGADTQPGTADDMKFIGGRLVDEAPAAQ